MQNSRLKNHKGMKPAGSLLTAGEKLTVTGEVMDKNDTVKRIELRVTMTNKEGEKVLKGKMQVLIDE